MIYSIFHVVLSKALIFIASFIAAKFLSVSVLGEFSFYSTFIASFTILLNFGLNTYLNVSAKSIFKNEPDKIITIFKLVFILSFLGSITASLWAVFNQKKLIDESDIYLFLLVFFVIFFSALNNAFESFLYSFGKYKKIAWNSLCAFIPSMLILYPAALYLELNGIILTVLVNRFIALILNCKETYSIFNEKFFLLLFRISICFNFIKKALIETGLPSFFSSLVVAPVLLVAFSIIKSLNNGSDILGYFAWPYQIFLVVTFIPSALTSYLLTKFSNETRKNILFIKVSIANFVFSSFFVSILYLFKTEVLLLAGEDFLTYSSTIYDLLLIAMVLHSINTAFGSYWFGVGASWMGFISNLSWAIAVLMTVSIYISVDPILALPVSLVISYLLMYLIQVIFFAKRVLK
jgi:O-antigen/teichoic acid export membrane protein